MKSLSLAHFEFFLSVLTHGISNTVRYALREENSNCTQTNQFLGWCHSLKLEIASVGDSG